MDAQHREAGVVGPDACGLSTAVLEESGAGLGVRVEEASQRKLTRSLEKLLFDPQYRCSAQNWAAVFSRYDSGVMFRKFLSDAIVQPAGA